IRHGHNAQVWIDGAKRIIFRRRLMRARDGVKKRRLSDVWKTNNSGAKHYFFVAAVSDGRKRATLRERRDSQQSGRRDWNPRPLEPHASALPSCATARWSEYCWPLLGWRQTFPS